MGFTMGEQQCNKLVAANPFTEMVLFIFTIYQEQTLMLMADASQTTQIFTTEPRRS
jgi:hypothetical protein